MNQQEMAVGDIDSQQKGSGARANGGKPKWQLMPLNQVAWLMRQTYPSRQQPFDPTNLMMSLGWFQRTGTWDCAYGLLLESVNYLKQEMDCDLVTALEFVIEVWVHGEEKYAAFNWMKGMPWSEVIASTSRHIMWMERGQEFDKESGYHHGAHVVCNAMMLCHYVDNYLDGNDLPTKWFDKG